MDLVNMCSEDLRWIELAQDRVQLWALVLPLELLPSCELCAHWGTDAYQIYCPSGLVRGQERLPEGGGGRTLSPHSRFKR
jgi:hypothetical protein